MVATSTFPPAGPAEIELRDAARAVSAHAYVPYSKFPVGAAIRLRDGSIVAGCNIENASFGLTVCAERTAFVRLIAEGRDIADVEAVAIHVEGDNGSPCGACRQFMLELAPDATVAFVSAGTLVACPARELVPAAFDARALHP